MKLISSLAFVAALSLSTSAASHLDSCPGNEKLFDLDSASFETNTINPLSEICLLIKGDLKTDIPPNGSILEVTVELPGDIKLSWPAPVYSSLRFPVGAELPVPAGSGRELKPCFYLPPQFKDTKAGVEILISAKITREDEDGDGVRVLCVRGVARVG
ncbi:hypothetical protein BGZ58_000873 [Dissophora ornata]|nr:hypothetical protein BGZ58_000873 [Dissophora ornata]